MAVSLPDADETALNASALAGDEDALAHLLTLHRPLAYNVAYRLLGREADASDAVQEASLLALRAVRGEGAPPREVDHFKAWLLRIVINAALGELRRRPNGSQIPLDAVAEALPGSDRAEPAPELERREARGDVLRALLVLPDTQRVALTLREFQELSYDEIADVLGVGRPAVAQLLFRARRNFRAAYEGLAETNGAVGCPELAPLVAAVLDGEVVESAWPKLQAHLGGCRRCRRELNGLRRTRRLHALIPILAPPIGWCWSATATANAAGLAAVATAGPAAIAPAVVAPAVIAPAVIAPAAVAPLAASAAPVALGGGLLAKIAGVAAAKVAAPVIAAGLSVAVVAAPAPAFDPSDAAPAIELPSAAAESAAARSSGGGDGSLPVGPAWVVELPAHAEAPPSPPEPAAATERVSREPGPPADAAGLAHAVVLSGRNPDRRSPADPPASPSAATDTAQPTSAAVVSPSSDGLGQQVDLAGPAPALVAALQPDSDAKDQAALSLAGGGAIDTPAVQRVQRSMAAQPRQDRAALADRREADPEEQPAPTPRATPSPPSAPSGQPLAIAAMAPPTVAPNPQTAAIVNPTATPPVAPTQPPVAVATQQPSATPKEQPPTSEAAVAVSPTPRATVTGPTPTPLADLQMIAEEAELKEQIATLKAQLAVAPAPRQAALREELAALRDELAALREEFAALEEQPSATTDRPSDGVVERQRLTLPGRPPPTHGDRTVERPESAADDPPERKVVAAFARQPAVELGREAPPSRRPATDVVEASGEIQRRSNGSERLSESELGSQPPLQSSTASADEPDPTSKHEAEPTAKREHEPTSKREPELAPKLDPELAPDLKPTDDDKEHRKLKDKDGGEEKEPPKLKPQQSSKAKCKKGQKRSNGTCKSKSQKGSGEQAKVAAESRKS